MQQHVMITHQSESKMVVFKGVSCEQNNYQMGADCGVRLQTPTKPVWVDAKPRPA
jgi:hypothetical protein